ncbi:MAG: cation diffusion facilitator family transporter [Desulfohalobiaceae bacterium]
MALRITRFALLSISASMLTLALKLSAYFLTSSVGLLSDALETVINLSAGLLLLFTLSQAYKPADRKHAFGYGKLEYLTGAVEALLILAAAGGIVYMAIQRLLSPALLTQIGPGLIIAILAAAINFLAAKIMLKAAQEYESIALEADARHLLTDVWTSLGLVLSLGLMQINPQKLWFLDPLLAVLLAANISWTGLSLLWRSISGLLDQALPSKELQVIMDKIRKIAGPQARFHALKTRKSGAYRFIQFHLLLPGHYSVQQAHNLCCRIEESISWELPRTRISIHVEPLEDGSSWDEEQTGGLRDLDQPQG